MVCRSQLSQVLLAEGPRNEVKYLALSRVFCAAGSQLRVHKNTSWVVSGSVRQRTRHPHTPRQTPHQERTPIFAGYGCLRGAVAVRKSSANVQLGGVFCPILCPPDFDQFRLFNNLDVEV